MSKQENAKILYAEQTNHLLSQDPEQKIQKEIVEWEKDFKDSVLYINESAPTVPISPSVSLKSLIFKHL
ncbi:hypothetical protein [Priestia aryabhattai]